MSNPLEAIGHGLKVAAVDTGKAVETAVDYAVVHPIAFLVKAEKVLAEAIREQPAIKQAVLDLVKEAGTVIGDVSTAAAAKGINLAADSQALKDAEAFFVYFRDAFIPLVEKVYSEVAADLK